jgi:hypothetical protein
VLRLGCATATAAVAFVALAGSTVTRAAGVPTFADMPWGASRAEVLEAAAASGLTVVAHHGNDVELTGELFGTAASVKALLSPTSGLVKVQVHFTSTAAPARIYASVVQRLTSLYGPTEPVELFKRPYMRGDGREDEALLSGKGMLIAAWGDEREPGQAAVIVHAGQPGVELEYESHAWKAESARRQRQDTPSRPALASAAPVSHLAVLSVGP